MFHDTFYHNLAGEPTTIDLMFQLYFKTFWITHDKAKQIKGCQDKAFKPGVKLNEPHLRHAALLTRLSRQSKSHQVYLIIL